MKHLVHRAILIFWLLFGWFLSPVILPAAEPNGEELASSAPAGRFGRGLDLRSTLLRTRSIEAYQRRPITVEFWTCLPSEKKDRYNILVSHLPESSPGHWKIYSAPLSGHLTVLVAGTKPRLCSSYVRITDDRWHHVMMVLTDEAVSLFVDGRAVGSDEVQRREHGEPEDGELTIGAPFESDSGKHNVTLIDELRISDTARSIETVPAESPLVDEHTVGLWRFEESFGTRYRDASRKSNSLAFSPGIDPAWTPISSSRQDAEPWEKEDDRHWNDDRFERMDAGPVRGMSMKLLGRPGKGSAYAAKGLAIRLGEEGNSAVLFDRANLRMTAAWTGGYIEVPARRFGLIQHPSPIGEILFASPQEPGWDSPADLEMKNLSPWAPLPPSWARYQGLYLYGKRTILSYTVGSARVLEMPWVETQEDRIAITRTLQIDPFEQTLRLNLLNVPGASETATQDVKIVSWKHRGELFVFAKKTSSDPVTLELSESRLQLVFGPHSEPIRTRLFIWKGPEKQLDQFVELVRSTGKIEDLGSMTHGGPKRWTEEITTIGSMGKDDGQSPFVVDTLTLPYDNSYGSIFYVTGVGFLPDGVIAISTIYGDVWLVEGADQNLDRLRWRRFATGMYQPLGLAVKDAKVYVLERGQITCLEDRNGDGEADFYRNVYNGWETCGAGHAFDTCLHIAPDGFFFCFKGQVPAGQDCKESGCLLRIEPDGSGHEVFATGFRHPIGLAVGPDGTVTGADQQGNWMPATRIDQYRRGGFYGDMRTHHRVVSPTTYDPPLLWLPHSEDNSAGGQIWVPDDRWGPLGGGLLHLSWGRCRLYWLMRQPVGDLIQGAAVRLPIRRLLSGTITGSFSPHDGHLYVAGMHGWQTSAEKDGCLERIRYTGRKIYFPLEFEARSDGIVLRFDQPIDPRSANDLDNFTIEQWNYRYSGEYGSDHWSVADPNRMGHDLIPLSGIELSLDGKELLLRTSELAPVMQMKITNRLLAKDGTLMNDTVHCTIHQLESVDDTD